MGLWDRYINWRVPTANAQYPGMVGTELLGRNENDPTTPARTGTPFFPGLGGMYDPLPSVGPPIDLSSAYAGAQRQVGQIPNALPPAVAPPVDAAPQQGFLAQMLAPGAAADAGPGPDRFTPSFYDPRKPAYGTDPEFDAMMAQRHQDYVDRLDAERAARRENVVLSARARRLGVHPLVLQMMQQQQAQQQQFQGLLGGMLGGDGQGDPMQMAAVMAMQNGDPSALMQLAAHQADLRDRAAGRQSDMDIARMQVDAATADREANRTDDWNQFLAQQQMALANLGLDQQRLDLDRQRIAADAPPPVVGQAAELEYNAQLLGLYNNAIDQTSSYRSSADHYEKARQAAIASVPPGQFNEKAFLEAFTAYNQGKPPQDYFQEQWSLLSKLFGHQYQPQFAGQPAPQQ